MLTDLQIRTLLDRGDDEDLRLLQAYVTDPYYSFTPRPDSPEEFDEQTSFVESQHSGIICAIAGNASGKSLAAAWKVANFIRNNEAPADLCKYFIVSQSLQMVGMIWQEKLSNFVPESMIESIQYFNSKENHPKSVILKPGPNGNRWMLAFRSYEMGRKALQAASQVAGYWCDEQIGNMNLLSELDTRCREYTYPGSKLYTLTPLEPDEDLESRFNNPNEFPYWNFHRLNAEKNFESGGISNLEWLKNCPADMRETRRIGDFCTLQGATFKEFDENIHVITPRPLSRHAIYFRSIDFGFTHDTACLLMAEDQGSIYVLKEWGASGLRVSEKVEAINREMPGNYITYADPEDAQQRAEFAMLGMNTTIAHKEPVEYSVELARTRMIQKTVFVFSPCKKVISQIKNSRWKLPKEGHETLNKERLVKRNDDYCDAFRMGIYSRHGRSLKAWDAAKVSIAPMSRI